MRRAMGRCRLAPASRKHVYVYVYLHDSCLSKSPFWFLVSALFGRHVVLGSAGEEEGAVVKWFLSEPRRDIEKERSWVTLAVCIVRISVAPQVSLQAVSGHVPGPALRTSSDVLKC